MLVSQPPDCLAFVSPVCQVYISTSSKFRLEAIFMSKNPSVELSGRKKAMGMTTRTLTYCALMAALQVAMARLFGLMPSEFTRFSIEAIPTILAGLFFGPVAGGLVGFTADLKPVDVVYQGDGYTLVRANEKATGGDILRSGDEVIVTASELYDGKVVQ